MGFHLLGTYVIFRVSNQTPRWIRRVVSSVCCLASLIFLSRLPHELPTDPGPLLSQPLPALVAHLFFKVPLFPLLSKFIYGSFTLAELILTYVIATAAWTAPTSIATFSPIFYDGATLNVWSCNIGSGASSILHIASIMAA